MSMHTSWESLFTSPLAEADREIDTLIGEQKTLNQDAVNLVASETYCPRATLEAEASAVVNKNASG